MISTKHATILLFATLALCQVGSGYRIYNGRQFGWNGGEKGGNPFNDGIGATKNEMVLLFALDLLPVLIRFVSLQASGC